MWLLKLAGKHDLEEFSRFFRNCLCLNLGEKPWHCECAVQAALLPGFGVWKCQNFREYTQTEHCCLLLWSLSLLVPMDGSHELDLVCRLFPCWKLSRARAQALHWHLPVHAAYLWAWPRHRFSLCWAASLTQCLDTAQRVAQNWDSLGKASLYFVRRELNHLFVNYDHREIKLALAHFIYWYCQLTNSLDSFRVTLQSCWSRADGETRLPIP